MSDRTDARTSLRVDWVLAALSVWLIGGFYVDLWAHAHGEVDDTFFTPWHGLLYSGAASFGIALALVAILGSPRGVPVRDVLPAPYRMGLLGAVLFVVGGVVDLAWHEAFGFEVDVEALLSPTHLLLAAAGLFMIGAPLRSAAARMESGGQGERSWRIAAPFVIPLAMAFAVLSAFTQYANPIVDPWAARGEGSPDDPPAQIYAMSPDGSGQRRLTVVDADARGPRMSPDGTSIVYALWDGERYQLHVMAPDGTGDRALTADASNFRPDWSPDGRRIVFASERDDGIDLYAMDADGSNVVRLTDDPALDWAPAWSPDGQFIAFTSNRSGSYDLYRTDADGSNLVRLTDDPGNEFDPAWDPFGSLIAFTSDREDRYGIWVTGPDGLVAGPRDVGPGDNYMPAWSPTGSMLAFTSNRTGDFEVFVVPWEGGEAQNVSQNPGADDGWDSIDWTPSGAQILYPSQAALSADRDPFVRQGFGAAGILVFAALIAGVIVFARRRGPLPIGSFLVLVAVPASMATVLSDEYRFIPAAVVAGILAEVAAQLWPPGRNRVADALAASLTPATFFACYFAAIALTDGLGWSPHLWLGATVVAGVIGMFLDELARRPVRSRAVP